MPGVELRLLGVGDNCVDHYLPPIDRRFPGGNVLNVVANWLSHGFSARYAGAVGDDADGALIRQALADLGDDGSLLDVVPGARTGISTIAVSEAGEPVFVEEVYGVSGKPPLTPALLSLVREARPIVHLSTNGDALSVARTLRETGATLSCDFGYHLPEMTGPERRELLRVLRFAFVSAGHHADDSAVDELAAALAHEGPEVVLVGRGGRGVRGIYAGEVVSAPPVSGAAPVDSLGAGDALIAGVLAAAATGASVGEQLLAGQRWAADACSHEGAFRYDTVRGDRS